MSGTTEKNPGRATSSRFNEICLVALVAVAVFALAFSLVIGRGLHRDEHQHVAAGTLLARNWLLPYQDYPFFHMPYLAFIYGGIFIFSDHLFFSARIFSMVAVSCRARSPTRQAVRLRPPL